MRGRGMRLARGGGSHRTPANYSSPGHLYASHIPFDLTECEGIFPRVSPAPDDKLFTEALLKRNQELTPAVQQQNNIQGLVSRVCSIIDALILVPSNFEPAQIEEVRQVGSFKFGTMMANHNVADLVVILRTLPTREAVLTLGSRLVNDLKACNMPEVPVLMMIEDGFEIISGDSVVRCLITTIPLNLALLIPEVHMDVKVMHNHLAAVRHARWFEENASQSSVKVLVRLLKDLRSRVEGFKSLSPWMVILLAHHAVMNNMKGQPLPINQAFRRCLQLLAAGLFLPGSSGIVDPCRTTGSSCHTSLPLCVQDRLCCSAQTLTRVLSYGGYRQILEIEGTSGVSTEPSIWDGVVVTPSEPVCRDKNDHQDDALSEASEGTVSA